MKTKVSGAAMRIPMASPAHQLHQLKAASAGGNPPSTTSAATPMVAPTRQLSGAAANSRRTMESAVSRVIGKRIQRRAMKVPAKAWSEAPTPT